MGISDIKQNKKSYFISSSINADSIFSGLDNSRLMELDQMQQTSIYPASVIVFAEGEQPKGIYFVAFGRVKLWSYLPNGRAVILNIATSGDVFGVKALLSERPYILTAETIEPTCLYFICKDDFLGFLNRNVDICLELVRNLSEELYEAHKEVRDVAFKESYIRLVELLLRLCQIHGELIAGGPKLLLSIKRRLDNETYMATNLRGISSWRGRCT